MNTTNNENTAQVTRFSVRVISYLLPGLGVLAALLTAIVIAKPILAVFPLCSLSTSVNIGLTTAIAVLLLLSGSYIVRRLPQSLQVRAAIMFFFFCYTLTLAIAMPTLFPQS